MPDNLLEKKKIDPSESKQVFNDINIRIHCCRYWILEEWECNNMAFPFWRLYSNTRGPAQVAYKDTIHSLTGDKIAVIPPNTPFSASLKGDFDNKKENIVGKRIQDLSEVDGLDDSNKADHLFIHFNLGLLADTVNPGIYVFENSPELQKLISKIKLKILSDSVNIDLNTTIAIHALITNLVNIMNPDLSGSNLNDPRVLNAMMYIDNNIGKKIDNQELAQRAYMAKNSFARLFHQCTQSSLQEYIRKKRVEAACYLMHHSNETIEMIALNCGFYDRFHFSRTFKKLMNVSPAYYKKHHTLDT